MFLNNKLKKLIKLFLKDYICIKSLSFEAKKKSLAYTKALTYFFNKKY